MFRIVTDTSSNLPTAYLQAENITVIPFTFHTESGEQSCMDTATFDAKAFYTAMRNGEKVTTSQIAKNSTNIFSISAGTFICTSFHAAAAPVPSQTRQRKPSENQPKQCGQGV